MKRAVLGFCSIALAACAGPVSDYPNITRSSLSAETIAVQRGIVDRFLGQQDRVQDIAWPILRENTLLCGQTKHSFGFVFGNDENLRDAVDGFTLKQIRAMGFDARPMVFAVADASPAAEAGLEPGMIILAVGEAEINGDIKLLRKALASRAKAASLVTVDLPPLALKVLDGTEVRTLEMVHDEVCSANISAVASNVVNASAGTRNISIFSGILEQLPDDDHVAVIIGHELGHVAGRHVRKAVGNATKTGYVLWGVPIAITASVMDTFLAAPLEAFAGVETPPGQQLLTGVGNGILRTQSFEREADYVGLYMATRAGYDTTDAEEVFRRLSLLSPRSTYGNRTHPTTPERMKAITLTKAEIAEKSRRGDPIIPNGWPVEDGGTPGAETPN